MGDFYWLFKNSDKICINLWKYYEFYWPNMWKQFIAGRQIPEYFDSAH